MHGLSLCMKEIDGLKKLFDGAFDEVLFEATTLHEDSVHITQTHLGDLESEDDVVSMRTRDLKEGQKLPDVVDSHVFAGG